MDSKRRSHSRVPAGVTVTLRRPDGTTLASEQLANVSLGGVFIAMPEPLPFGTEVSLEFVLPARPRPLTCRGLVVWTSADHRDVGEERRGIGVRLMELSAGDMRTLADFIERSLRL